MRLFNYILLIKTPNSLFISSHSHLLFSLTCPTQTPTSHKAKLLLLLLTEEYTYTYIHTKPTQKNGKGKPSLDHIFFFSFSLVSSMDTAAQWPQEIVVKPIEEIVTKPAAIERKVRPQKEHALNCPRCNSTNTKFCYYNNYSLTQPRYFCKTCRRYWTEGGSLRNIPVGGGSRKNKRSSSSSTSSSSIISSSKKLSDLISAPLQTPNDQAQDLNLSFPATAPQGFASLSQLVQVPTIDNNNNNNKNQISSTTSTTTTTSTSTATTTQLSALELLTGMSTRGLNSFMPMPIPDPTSVYTSGLTFPLQDLKPTLNFSLDGLGTGYGSLQETNGRLLFPFEDLKQVSSTGEIGQNREQGDSAGYWTGMLGGSGSW